VTRSAARLARVLALAASAALVVARGPMLLTRPRFWAEEGFLHFAAAYCFAHTAAWYQSLLPTFQGYFTLWPNLAATVAANLAPLERAPLVTTLFALAVQLAPVAIILWSSSAFASPVRKVLGVACVLFAPLSGEVWLNTVTSQFHLALVTFLLILEESGRSRARRWLARSLLAIAGLTGPVSCFLTPLLVARAASERTRERFVQAGILAACALAQLAVVASSPTTPLLDRLRGFGAADLAAIAWLQSTSLVLSGLGGARAAAGLLGAARAAGWAAPLAWGLLIGEVALLWALARPLPRAERSVFLAGYGSLVVLSVLGAVDREASALVPGFGQRYFFAPNAILLLLLAANVVRGGGRRLQRAACAALLVVSLGFALHSWRRTLLATAAWPDWEGEVRAWREDPAYELQVWPPDTWKVILRRCDA